MSNEKYLKHTFLCKKMYYMPCENVDYALGRTPLQAYEHLARNRKVKEVDTRLTASIIADELPTLQIRWEM